MIERFTSFIDQHRLFQKNEKILLAVSGGMDSMAMLELFRQAGFRFDVVHCNFKLRGKASDADEALVRETAARLGVKCHSRSFETNELAKERKESVQMIARELRYAYFDEVADAHAYRLVATAHHLDDQIETFFINLLRGSGIAGLHGIPLSKGRIIRPLLFAYRNDIEEFVELHNIAYREDASNQSLKYRRNTIRHEILPQLLKLNPSFRQELNTTIGRLAAVEKVFREYLAMQRKTAVQENNGITSIDIGKLKLLDPLPLYLYEFISSFGFNHDDVSNIISALDGTPGKTFLSPSHQLIVDRKKLLVSPRQRGHQKETFYIQLEMHRMDKPLQMTFTEVGAENYVIPEERGTASLDMGKLDFPLTLRKWKHGDSFMPLGMSNMKKLSDFFIDEKLSILQKQDSWVMCSGPDIVWVIGHRIDERYKVTGRTRTVFQVRLI